MNQNNDSEPKVRRSPPQLFGNLQANQSTDFQSSILATITGEPPSRNATRRTVPRAGLFAIAVGLTVGLCGFFFYQRGTSVEPITVAAVPLTASVVASPVATLPDAGASVIDTPSFSAAQHEIAPATVPPPASIASAAAEGINPATAPVQAPTTAVAHGEPRIPKRRVASTDLTERNRVSAGKAAKRPEPDHDVALLAAMLPYIAAPDSPSSAAFERRCGTLSGEPARTCRARFCNGREGLDAACPRGDVR